MTTFHRGEAGCAGGCGGGGKGKVWEMWSQQCIWREGAKAVGLGEPLARRRAHDAPLVPESLFLRRCCTLLSPSAKTASRTCPA